MPVAWAPVDLGEIERKTAPATADIEDVGARINEKLGGKMALLGELGVVERLVVGLEIGAAILLVGVEEERVEPAVEVVVVSHIAPRPRTQIELLNPAKQVAHEACRQRPFGSSDAFLPQQDCERIRDRAFLDHECSVHVSLAESQLGIEQDCALGSCVGEAHGDRRPAAVAEHVSLARRCGDRKGTVADKPLEKYRQ